MRDPGPKEEPKVPRMLDILRVRAAPRRTSRENSKTVTASVHNCDGGIGVRGRRDVERS